MSVLHGGSCAACKACEVCALTLEDSCFFSPGGFHDPQLTPQSAPAFDRPSLFTPYVWIPLQVRFTNCEYWRFRVLLEAQSFWATWIGVEVRPFTFGIVLVNSSRYRVNKVPSDISELFLGGQDHLYSVLKSVNRVVLRLWDYAEWFAP